MSVRVAYRRRVSTRKARLRKFAFSNPTTAAPTSITRNIYLV